MVYGEMEPRPLGEKNEGIREDKTVETLGGSSGSIIRDWTLDARKDILTMLL